MCRPDRKPFVVVSTLAAPSRRPSDKARTLAGEYLSTPARTPPRSFRYETPQNDSGLPMVPPSQLIVSNYDSKPGQLITFDDDSTLPHSPLRMTRSWLVVSRD